MGPRVPADHEVRVLINWLSRLPLFQHHSPADIRALAKNAKFDARPGRRAQQCRWLAPAGRGAGTHR